MNRQTRRLAFLMAFIFVLQLASIIVYIAVYTSPYLQDFTHPDAKTWFAGSFMRFSYTMVAFYLMATGATLWAFVVHYRSDPPLGVRWLTELLCFYTFIILFVFFFAGDFYLALERGVLGENVTLQIAANHDLYETGRLAAFVVSFLIIALIYVRVTILKYRLSDKSD